ncbi:MAG: SEC-C domain-containing protein [Bacteroidetes bacterium]|nr:SEC-C domain-containing protein [Bacteroidota bacterium]
MLERYFVEKLKIGSLKKMKKGRNELCNCGSSKKYKKCCIEKNRPTQRVSKKNQL